MADRTLSRLHDPLYSPYRLCVERTSMTTLETARQKAAAAYPEHITDTHGRVHDNIPRRAILSGAWDNGNIVKRYLTGD